MIFAHTFDSATAPTRHRTQYFEMFGHRAIDHDGWRAVCPWPGPSFAEAGKPFGAAISVQTLTDLDVGHWELYHVAEDHDLAGQHRDKLIELIAMWYTEAGKYNVFPIDGSAHARINVERPQIAEPRTEYIYRPGTQTLPYFVAPRVLNRPHAITADAEIPAGGAEGVLLCQATPATGRSTSRTAGCATPTTTSPGRPTRSARRIRFPWAGTSCDSSSSQSCGMSLRPPRQL